MRCVKRAREYPLFGPRENEFRTFCVAVQYRTRRTHDMECTIDWLATGGTMLPDGRFTGDATGHYTVTAQVRGQT